MRFFWLGGWLLARPASAIRIGDLEGANLLEQVQRFFSFSDPALGYALVGSILLGLACGLLGTFVLLRRLSMMGDTLGHSVLPGVVLAFTLTGQKDVVLLLAGACLAGLAASFSVWLLQRTTSLKEDTCMGLVLSTYFALGIVGLTRLSKSGLASQTGLDKFLFGQAAALGGGDLLGLGLAALLNLALVVLLYKEMKLVAFDADFARSLGLPVQALHGLLMLAVTFTLVTALQAVGAVLVSAMLVTPAATASLLSTRLPKVLGLAVFFGILSGCLGTFFSFVGSNLPTGPCMVMSASALFALAWLAAPEQGWLTRAWRQARRRRKVALENTLKDIFLLHERQASVDLEALCQARGLTLKEVQSRLKTLRRLGYLSDHSCLQLSPKGQDEARRLVRNHRLWELFLTHEAQIAPDHVHRDAEELEHFLSPELVQRLEQRLGHPTLDPHGSPIP